MCPQLSDLIGGSVTVSAHILVPGSRAMYSCDNRHRLSGSSVRECQEDGTWSEIEPTCEGSYGYGMIIYHDQHFWWTSGTQ